MGGGHGSGEPKNPLDGLAFYLLVEEYEHRRALAKRLGKTIESFDPVFTAYVQKRTRTFALDIGAIKCHEDLPALDLGGVKPAWL